MNWIRISVAIADDPRVHELAAALDLDIAHAVGLLVCLLRKFPEHAPKGEVGGVRDSLLELWALWQGKRGRFAAPFRTLFLSEAGVWIAWEKHNGKALAKLDRDRERIRLSRELRVDGVLSVAGVSRDSSATVAGTDGRTDELPSGARARRNGHGDRPTYAPGHVNLPKGKPWCAHCGDGVPAHLEGGKRGDRLHGVDCPLREVLA